MAQGVKFDGSNRVFTAPRDETGVPDDRVMDLHVFDNGACLVSCWELSEAEWAEISRTRKIYLSLFSRGMQPVFIGSESAVKDLLSDIGGVWKKS